jgi:hypothetical protein
MKRNRIQGRKRGAENERCDQGGGRERGRRGMEGGRRYLLCVESISTTKTKQVQRTSAGATGTLPSPRRTAQRIVKARARPPPPPPSPLTTPPRPAPGDVLTPSLPSLPLSLPSPLLPLPITVRSGALVPIPSLRRTLCDSKHVYYYLSSPASPPLIKVLSGPPIHQSIIHIRSFQL